MCAQTFTHVYIHIDKHIYISMYIKLGIVAPQANADQQVRVYPVIPAYRWIPSGDSGRLT